jgi:hypothetical protein
MVMVQHCFGKGPTLLRYESVGMVGVEEISARH